MLSTSGEIVEVLNFRHFARYMSFTPTGKQGKEKRNVFIKEQRAGCRHCTDEIG